LGIERIFFESIFNGRFFHYVSQVLFIWHPLYSSTPIWSPSFCRWILNQGWPNQTWPGCIFYIKNTDYLGQFMIKYYENHRKKNVEFWT
jgi:hypothetical protein